MRNRQDPRLEHAARGYLQKTVAGLTYVVDEEDGLYEIETFLGDVPGICQVYRARYFSQENTDVQRGRPRGCGIHSQVALKLAWISGSDKFTNMRQEVDRSFTIGSDIGQENNNFVPCNHILVGIYKSFEYRGFLCVSMPYFVGGSLRYMINDIIPDRKLPEWCIAVVLRGILTALQFLHARDRVHAKLNAGNIFFGSDTMKLGFQGSTYFHNPEADQGIPKIWENSGRPCFGNLYVASELKENKFWTIPPVYEPSSSREQQNYNLESDIWNVGVTALELALGPFHFHNYVNYKWRNPDEFHTFLKDLCYGKKLPSLFRLFHRDSGSTIPKKGGTTDEKSTIVTTSSSRPIAAKMRKDLINAGKKVKAKILGRKLQEAKPRDELKPRDEPSFSLTEMVKRCLVFDPAKRPTAEELLEDDFFEIHRCRDLKDLKYFILSHDPKPRPTRYF